MATHPGCFSPITRLRRTPPEMSTASPSKKTRSSSFSNPPNPPPIDDLQAFLSTDFDVREGIRKVLLMLSKTTSQLNNRLDRVDEWLKNIDDSILVLEERVSAIENSSTNNELSDRVDVIMKENLSLRKRLVDIEDRSRRNNLVIAGLEETPNESWEETELKVCNLFKDHLLIDNFVIERAHRVGMKSSNKPRQIICKLLSFKDKQKIKKNGFRLKGTNIYVNDDFSATTRSARFQLRKFAGLQKESGAKLTRLNHDRLNIDGKIYVFDPLSDKVVELESSNL